MLLALGIGLLPNEYSAFVVRAMVRHPGPPVPFEIVARTRDNSSQPWEPVEGVKYFPLKVKTSPLGRSVTVRLPSTLKKQTQVCAYLPPPPAQPLQVSVGLLSCANLRTHSALAWGFSSPLPDLKAAGWSWLRPMAPLAASTKANAPH